MSSLNLFEKCLYVVLKNEGGYSDHPLDTGGKTCYGITQAVYDKYRADKGLSFEAVLYITNDEVRDIYLSMYWKPMNLELLMDDDLVLHVFDHGVNAGPSASIKMLQRLVGVEDDGDLGPQTAKAVREFNGDVEAEFIKRRKLFYVTLAQNKPQLRRFLKGWLARVDNTTF